MTKLDAVNIILRKCGLLTISALETGSASTVATIERILDERTLRVLTENWHFNQRRNVTIVPTTLSITQHAAPVTVHLTEAQYQRTHPLVASGVVQCMPTINLEFVPNNYQRDPTMYPFAGQYPGDSTIITNVARAIGVAKAAGKRCIVQIAGSGKKWCMFTDMSAGGGQFGELSYTDLNTAINAGAFSTTSESARIAGIVSGITAILDSQYGGARPDGLYHDNEYIPTFDVIQVTASSVGLTALNLALLDATPVTSLTARINAKLAAGYPAGSRPGGIPNQFAADAVVKEIVYSTLKTEWAGFGADCKHYVWDFANSSVKTTGQYYGDQIAAYPVNVDASHIDMLAPSQAATDAISGILDARVVGAPFAIHVSVPYGNPYAVVTQVNSLMEICRTKGISDIFVFAPSLASDDVAGDADAAAKLTSLQPAIESAVAPTSSTSSMSGGNIMLSTVAATDPNCLSILEITTDGQDASRSVTTTSDRLFDLDNNSDFFDGTLTVRFVMEMGFASLPPKVQEYVACEAAAAFNDAYGQPQRGQLLRSDALRARAQARGSDSRMAQANILGARYVQDTRGNRIPFPGGPFTGQAQRVE